MEKVIIDGDISQNFHCDCKFLAHHGIKSKINNGLVLLEEFSWDQ